jgi:hypothetical protein
VVFLGFVLIIGGVGAAYLDTRGERDPAHGVALGLTAAIIGLLLLMANWT